MKEQSEYYMPPAEQWPEIHMSPRIEKMMKDPKIMECLEDTRKFDPEITYKHVVRTAEILDELIKKIELTDEEKGLLLRASLLHDVGKIYIDKKILDKNGKLTKEEQDIVDKHAEFGFTYLKNKGLDDEAEIVIRHHEKKRSRRDNGDRRQNDVEIDFPSRRNEKRRVPKPELDRLARILSIVDIFEATTSNRYYLDKNKDAVTASRDVTLQGFNLPEEKKIIDIMKSMMKKDRS